MTRSWGSALAVVAAAASVLVGPGSACDCVDDGPVVALRTGPLPTAAALAAVTVRVESRGGGVFDGGAGVAIAPGLVLTSRHLLDQRVVFATWCGSRPLEVGSVDRSEGPDLALVSVGGARLPDVPIAPTDPPPGTALALAGFPRGGPFTTQDVRVVDYVDGPHGRVLRFTPMPEVGQSGGPLVDGDGNLVGVAYAREEVAGVGHAVSASEVRSVVADAMAERRDALVLIAGGGAAAALRPVSAKVVAKAANAAAPFAALLDTPDPARVHTARCS